MDFVVQHALDNVWAEDIQDKDYYIRPTRITPNGGSLKYAEVGMVSVGLPNVNVIGSKVFYHVYHIGQLPPQLLGIDIVENRWITIDEIADKLECYVNVFLDNGYVVPRSKCHLLRMWPGKNVIMAIEYVPQFDFGYQLTVDAGTNASRRIPNTLNNQDINIRFYTNARFFATDRRDDATNADNQMYFQTEPYTNAVLTRIKNNKNNKQVPQGWFVAAGKVYNYAAIVDQFFNLQNQEISVYRDETILDIEYFKLQDMVTFISDRNRNVKKYLVNLNTPAGQLVYHNDVEYYLGTYKGGQFKGLCIPVLRIDPITTITNKTHAIRADVITDLINKNDWLQNDDVHIMAVIRQGGMLRGLIHQNTRIEELFKLPNTVVNSALTGVNALMDEWKAANLEKDDYAQIVEAKRAAVVDDLVFNAYGYNAISRYHHPNPLTVSNYTTDANGQKWYSVQLSNVASERNSLVSSSDNVIEVIEYDDKGLFIGRKRVPYMNAGLLVSGYSVARPVKLIEHYINSVNDTTLNLGENFDNVITDNDLGLFGFAAYITTSNTSTIAPKWVDVSHLNTYFYIDDYKRADGSVVKRLTWNLANLQNLGARGMVRINNRSCFKTFDIKSLIKGGRSFPILTIPNNSNGKVQVEPGTIELWMENRLLIEDIDYVVAWPNIYIGRRIENINTAKLNVRLSGLAKPETSKHDKAREVGFVQGGVLSVNKHYDIRNDRNIQITVGGVLKTRDEVSFEEKPTTPSIVDGQPYQIKDYITPVELFTNRRTIIEKAKSEDIDQRVMDYLNQYLTVADVKKPVITNTRWLIVSVFLDEVIARLKAGWLANELKTIWNVSQIESWMSDLRYLLNVDVSYFDSTDYNYIRLIPHGFVGSISLTERQYMFLEQVCDHYLKGKVQLNHLITIQLGV